MAQNHMSYKHLKSKNTHKWSSCTAAERVSIVKNRKRRESHYAVGFDSVAEVGVPVVVTASKIECIGTGVRNGMPFDGVGFNGGSRFGSPGFASRGRSGSSLSFGGLIDGIGGSGKSHGRGT